MRGQCCVSTTPPILGVGFAGRYANRLLWIRHGQSEDGRIISGLKVRGMVADIAAAMARRGMTDLDVLYLQSEPVSFIWGVVRRQRL